MNEQLPALHQTAPATITRDDWTVLAHLAKTAIVSKLLPDSIDTPEKAIVIMLKGRELGLGEMYAMSNINVIKGKPVAGSEVLASLIYRDHGDNGLIVEETTAERCLVTYKRRGWDRPRQFVFTIEDAKRAGLVGKENWKNYPAAMLRARAISAVAHMAFQDSIGGMYTPEEMGAEVAVDPLTSEITISQLPHENAPTNNGRHTQPIPPEAAARADRLRDEAREQAKNALRQPSLNERWIAAYTTLVGNGWTREELYQEAWKEIETTVPVGHLKGLSREECLAVIEWAEREVHKLTSEHEWTELPDDILVNAGVEQEI